MSIAPSDADALGLLLDERAISRVVHAFCLAVDAGDMDGVRACYWPGAVDDHGFVSGDPEVLIAWLEKTMPRHVSTMHHLGSLQVDVDGDTARAVSTVVTVHVGEPVDDPRSNFIAAGRYHDRFERRAGEWRIVHRRAAGEWFTTSTAVPIGAGSQR